jgi:hypothetical protein
VPGTKRPDGTKWTRAFWYQIRGVDISLTRHHSGAQFFPVFGDLRNSCVLARGLRLLLARGDENVPQRRKASFKAELMARVRNCVEAQLGLGRGNTPLAVKSTRRSLDTTDR